VTCGLRNRDLVVRSPAGSTGASGSLVLELGDTDLLDRVTDEDRLRVGDSRAGEVPSPGAGGRVFDLLFLMGTTPNYRLPMITDALIEKVHAAFDIGLADGLPAVSLRELSTFLTQRRGWFLAPQERTA
jgi:hypothetical protein